ncbi:uncharacterized protein PHACADRAFT_262505 [Phanerochaete carnosa HHB-10118-sp]|uniref:Uncharacterized protein n=1 Tax=Phanerochaete carnosa (strain HHB-10118-sp) TaxID=650164 RepID=K5WP00_PHACS|nr:uncharacterized protein PHACADRAFT_262505 [Phanerochaete carnosa HHB-10118-sp]EKM52052.1 hypothetical protein PHACADRAFT_262505 [Phanerochaete carnosa HHB-10118-sp]
MARQLGALAPTFVKVPHPAKEHRSDERSSSPHEVPETQEEAADGVRFLDELPASMDIEIDMERVHELAREWRVQFARGVKPNVVIPRLSCLESQRDEY